jgi:hypothetical protein
MEDHGSIFAEPGNCCAWSLHQCHVSITFPFCHPRIYLAAHTAVNRHTVRSILSDETKAKICMAKPSFVARTCHTEIKGTFVVH